MTLGIKGRLRLELEDSELARDIAGENLFLNVTANRANDPSLACDLGAMDYVGTCPKCGNPVLVTELGYDCIEALSGGTGCKFSVRKMIKDREVTPTEFRTLLAHRRTALLEGFVSRKRATYVLAARLVTKDNGKLLFDLQDNSETG